MHLLKERDTLGIVIFWSSTSSCYTGSDTVTFHPYETIVDTTNAVITTIHQRPFLAGLIGRSEGRGPKGVNPLRTEAEIHGKTLQDLQRLCWNDVCVRAQSARHSGVVLLKTECFIQSVFR